MSMSDATENATLKAHLQGTDLTYRTGSYQYLALFNNSTGTPVDLEAGNRSYELTYTGYDRIMLTKSSAWTDGGATFTNADIIQFGARSDTGATQTAKYFAVVNTSSGNFTQCIWGTLTAELAINQNIQPQFSIATLSIVAD